MSGLAIVLFNGAEEIKQLGQLLIVIAILLRLLLHAKSLHLSPRLGAEPVSVKLFDDEAEWKRVARIE
jgi:hypothetical protein